MNIAFDIHGTLDSDPDGKLFSIFSSIYNAKSIFTNVYIISGPPIDQIKKELISIKIPPTMVKIVSVVDYLKSKGMQMWKDPNGNWWCSEKDWWSSKGQICKEYKIDIIFDDQIRYAKYMPSTTEFILWRNNHILHIGG